MMETDLVHPLDRHFQLQTKEWQRNLNSDLPQVTENNTQTISNYNTCPLFLICPLDFQAMKRTQFLMKL